MRTSHSERFTPHSIEDILKDRRTKKESDEEYDYRGGGDERLGETRRESDKTMRDIQTETEKMRGYQGGRR